ncbi:MAG: lipoprotein signal peptidase [Fibrobacteres bacterium]|nr:lipoprotein signal peptidase [Fibrobacterota bacterium]
MIGTTIENPVADRPSRTASHLGLSLLLAVTLAVDQWTKYLARIKFGFPDGEPDYFKVKHLVGEWLQFRLIYNTGAAFGMKPQQFLPFLNPTVFYVLFSTAAIGFLVFLYRKLPREDLWQKSGITLILSGAFGNLIDRLRFEKVTDFIDVGIPGFAWRWPTFNIADSCVCVGVAMILLSSWIPRKQGPNPDQN